MTAVYLHQKQLDPVQPTVSPTEYKHQCQVGKGLSSNLPGSFSQLKRSDDVFHAWHAESIAGSSLPTRSLPHPEGWERREGRRGLSRRREVTDLAQKHNILTPTKARLPGLLLGCRVSDQKTALSKPLFIVKKKKMQSLARYMYLELLCKVHTCLAVVNNCHLTKRTRSEH